MRRISFKTPWLSLHASSFTKIDNWWPVKQICLMEAAVMLFLFFFLMHSNPSDLSKAMVQIPKTFELEKSFWFAEGKIEGIEKNLRSSTLLSRAYLATSKRHSWVLETMQWWPAALKFVRHYVQGVFGASNFVDDTVVGSGSWENVIFLCGAQRSITSLDGLYSDSLEHQCYMVGTQYISTLQALCSQNCSTNW